MEEFVTLDNVSTEDIFSAFLFFVNCSDYDNW